MDLKVISEIIWACVLKTLDLGLRVGVQVSGFGLKAGGLKFRLQGRRLSHSRLFL